MSWTEPFEDIRGNDRAAPPRSCCAENLSACVCAMLLEMLGLRKLNSFPKISLIISILSNQQV